MKKITHIAAYQFLPLTNLLTLKASLLARCHALGLKGTILLSQEGINLSLAGHAPVVADFQAFLASDPRFASLVYRESYSDSPPFNAMKVKIKKEIITLDQPSVDAVKERAPAISPRELKQWLDDGRDITLLDTRNDYEVAYGTFIGAIHLRIAHFSHLPRALTALDRCQPLVMFCTGGIRCEKAAIYLLNHGFKEVYQLDGGILNYFATVGKAHYQGDCFVFDERIAISVNHCGLDDNHV
ncbi:MAG: hypothetical protein A3E85_03385 [Gammaproteobacteria bacterium RIFCSPHIGHO2_12_FULL_45_12]|nr:MAG: hypothetical protein A3E85_03385 [Gammaproteobacteria bacterium RIFCSPHIGHO2_12_FULL_45_12]